ncbi:hypothetical protein D3C76_1863990 [compost metagenome]
MSPSPNHSKANGSRAMAGNGLNIEVSVPSRSRPSWVETARLVRPKASTMPST